jgi:hypothetical protein
MRNIIFPILIFLSVALSAFTDSQFPRINPKWEDVWIYSDGFYSILYDSETNSIFYRYHLWKPWEMTHCPWCFCHDTELEIDDSTNVEDYEDEISFWFFTPEG